MNRNWKTQAGSWPMLAEQEQVWMSAFYVQQGSEVFSRTYGPAHDVNAMFLLASISKTISIAAVMTLFDDGHFGLEDRVHRYLPEFQGDGREKITVRQLMTHVSGLPDQLPENSRLRASHAPLSEFVAAAVKTPCYSIRVRNTAIQAWPFCWPRKSPDESAVFRLQT